MLVGFDEAVIAEYLDELGEDADVRAGLMLTIADSPADSRGAGWDVLAQPLLVDRTAGNGRTVSGWPEPPGQARGRPDHAGAAAETPTGEGPGATWMCATDEDISNRHPGCEELWHGGSFGPATAPPVRHHDDLDGEVAFDVTEDVLAGFGSWLLMKPDPRTPGTVAYYAKEGAFEAEDVSLAPRLILERVED